MSENRCKRCNRRLSDTTAQYGWKCAQILGYRNPNEDKTGRVDDVQHMTHRNIEKLERHGINWKSGVGEEMLYDMVRDEYMAILLKAADPDLGAPIVSTGKELEPIKNKKYPWEDGDIDLHEDERAALEHLWESDLDDNFKQNVWGAYSSIDDTGMRPDSIEDMEKRHTADILARMIYAEQRADINFQTAIVWALLNRFYGEGFGTEKIDGERKKRNLRNLIMRPGQFSTLTGNRENKPAYDAMDSEDDAWRNAKLLAAYMYAILGDKTREELAAEGMTYEKAAATLPLLASAGGTRLTNPFDKGYERYFDSWNGKGSKPLTEKHSDGEEDNVFFNYAKEYNARKKK